MTNNIPAAQPQVAGLAPYQPGMPIEVLARTFGLDPAQIIKLASNENPDGMGAAARQAMQAAQAGSFRYPDGYDLRQALAAHYGLDPAAITLGNGSNDVLDLIARVFLGNGTNAVSSQYAFVVYGLVTRIAGAENIIVPARDFGHDLEAMRAAITSKTRVVWIANPNNPTGTFVPYAAVEQFLPHVPADVIVVLDEAYYEYLAPGQSVDTTSLLEKYPNLILTRTFSKIYGLAGLRVGYALARPEIADMLNRVRQPFNVNHVGLVTATAALADRAFVVQSYEHNVQGRQQLLEAFGRLGLECLPAFGNFVTVAFADAAAANEYLLHQGIIVRPLKEYGMPGHLRITVGTKEENDKLIRTLETMPL